MSPDSPAAPAHLVARAGGGKVSLTWRPSHGATAYAIHRRPASDTDGDWTLIRDDWDSRLIGSGWRKKCGEVDVVFFDDTTVTNGSSYWYVVWARNANGTSAPSNYVLATPQEPNEEEKRKVAEFDDLILKVGGCTLCTTYHPELPNERRIANAAQHLLNFIHDTCRPRYGEIPSMYTDWRARLGAEIAVVGIDWGAEKGTWGALPLRHHYERLKTELGMSAHEAWRETIMNRPQPSDTHKNLKCFFEKSAEGFGFTPRCDYLDFVFFTNSVLCFRKGKKARGKDNMDIERAQLNCRDFLARQLEIVDPTVVLALGIEALKSLCGKNALTRYGSGSLGSVVRDAQEKSCGVLRGVRFHGLSLDVVPLFHPANCQDDEGRPRTYRERAKHISDWEYIWKAFPDLVTHFRSPE